MLSTLDRVNTAIYTGGSIMTNIVTSSSHYDRYRLHLNINTYNFLYSHGDIPNQCVALRLHIPQIIIPYAAIKGRSHFLSEYICCRNII